MQLADAPVPVREHGEPVKAPAPLLVNATVPVGVVAPVVDVSVTVAVQLVGEFTATDDGVHVTVVLVGWTLTATLPCPELVA